MKLKAQVAKIVAAAKEEIWGQVFQSNNLFLVVEIAVSEGYEAAPLGKELIDNLSSQFDKLSTVNLKNLKNLISFKDNTFFDLQIPQGTSLNLVLCALVNNFFYLLVLGQGKAFLKRGEKTAVLLEKEGSGSGVLQENDLLAIASPKFNQTVSFDVLRSTLNEPFEEIAEDLAPLIHAKENSFGAAAMFLRFNKKEESLKEEEEEEERETLEIRRFPRLLSKAKSLIPLSRLKPLLALKRKVNQEGGTKKTVLTVAVILTALLFVSIFFGFGNKRRTLQEAKFQEVFENASHKFEEGRALLDLNIPKSRELLKQARKVLESSREEFKKGSKERREIETLLEMVESALKETAKVYKLDQVSLFFDPIFLKDEALGEEFALYKDGLAILDKKQNTLYFLNLKEKKGKIIAGGEILKKGKVVGIHGLRTYVLTEEGIIETSIEEQTSSIKIKKDDEWGEIADLGAYRGNIYLLDKKGEIIKYLNAEEGFVKKNYLAPDSKIDLSQATSMAIDGDIWVANANKVLRFSLGQRQEFSLKGVEKNLSSNLSLYTDEECEDIYILDKDQKRIVVLNKEGEYQAQYEWEKLSGASDIVVSEKEGKILVLVEGKIYGINIKN